MGKMKRWAWRKMDMDYQPDVVTIHIQAQEFARNFSGFRRFMTALRPAICPFDRLVGCVPENSRVLDIGCGTGLFLFLLVKNRRLLSGDGIEVNAKSVLAARRAFFQSIGDQAPIAIRLAISESDWPTGPYDVVMLTDVMHHVPVKQQHAFFVAGTKRVRPGGLLVYKDMCHLPIWRAAANRLHDLIIAQQWINYVPVAQIEDWARQESMQLTHRDETAKLWYGHELRVFRRQSM